MDFYDELTRYKDRLIINFMAISTREGRVMAKLFERIQKIEQDLDPKQTGSVFNVLGDVFPVNFLERMVREMYARNQTEAAITERIVKEVDTERFRSITHSTLEGLAKRELDLSAIIGRSATAQERRLLPEVIEDYLLQASPIAKVKGRAAVGEIALTSNEYKTAERLKRDYWLYALFNCATTPKVHLVQDQARLGWEPVVQIEHFLASHRRCCLGGNVETLGQSYVSQQLGADKLLFFFRKPTDARLHPVGDACQSVLLGRPHRRRPGGRRLPFPATGGPRGGAMARRATAASLDRG